MLSGMLLMLQLFCAARDVCAAACRLYIFSDGDKADAFFSVLKGHVLKNNAKFVRISSSSE